MQIDLSELYGHFASLPTNMFIHLVIFTAILDIASGIMVAGRKREIDSTKGRKGMSGHALTLLVIAIGYPYARMMGYKFWANVFVWFYILNYAVSILENLALLGVKIPPTVLKYLKKVKHLVGSVDPMKVKGKEVE